MILVNHVRLTETPVRPTAVTATALQDAPEVGGDDHQMETESLLDSEYSVQNTAPTVTPQVLPTPVPSTPQATAPTESVAKPPDAVPPVPPLANQNAPEDGEVHEDGMSVISSEGDLMSNINLNDLTHLVDVQAGRSQEILNDQLASRPMRLADLDDTINRALQALNVSHFWCFIYNMIHVS